MGVAEQDSLEPYSPSISPSPDEPYLVEALRRGDEAAFAALIERYHLALLRLAAIVVSSRTAADELVRETWLGVLRGLPQFDGRASLKTWMFRILADRAAARGILFVSPAEVGAEPRAPTLDRDRFLPPDHAKWPGHWALRPASWADMPEDRLMAQEVRGRLTTALAALPLSQRLIVCLRDVEGWTAREVSYALDLSEAQQRMLLHQARSKVRRMLDTYLAGA
jgi:RNA polymerase sigma-70 factor (ECF subfamily)